MKRILQLMFLGTGIGILFSSCSMFSYTAHTAKTLAIENEVRQMPLVVDLHVDSTRWERDTAWENVLFKKHASVKNQMDYLVASILEESGADVLVEPKVSLDARMGWIRSRYDMKVMGYPARYVNFRPATMQDMRLLGMDTLDCRRDYPQVVINGAPGSWYDGRSVTRRLETKGNVRWNSTKGGRMAPAISAPGKPKKKKRPEPEVLRKPYTGMLDIRAAYSPSYGDGYASASWPAMFTTTHGANLGKRRSIFLGAGMGFGGNKRRLNHSDYDFSEPRRLFLPVYANVRFNLGHKKVYPFIDVRVGGAMIWEKNKVYEKSVWSDTWYLDYEKKYSYISLYYDVTVGVGIGNHFDLGITHMMMGLEDRDFDIGLKLGVRW